MANLGRQFYSPNAHIFNRTELEASEKAYFLSVNNKWNCVKEIGRATSELQSHSDLVCRLLLEKKKTKQTKKKNNKKIKKTKQKTTKNIIYAELLK